MTSSMFRTLGIAALGFALLSAIFSQPTLVGQEKAAKKAKGRLPPYFAQVVTEKQRTEIYTLQKKYSDQIDALEAQLKSLQEQRDAEIEGLLSEEQKAKLNKLRADAVSKRKAKSSDGEEPEAEAPATTTTTAATPTTTKAATTTKSKAQ